MDAGAGAPPVKSLWPYGAGKLGRAMGWQEPFCRTVLENDRVVLSAPTGAGKTAAALAPFVAGRARGFADRCIYVLPMRALARSLFDEYAPELAPLGIKTTLQMGGASHDPDYRGEVIFTTIDQLLSRYLNAPYGGRPANISAGALVGAHIVLDEFHLYPEDEARLTAITMLDHLRGLSSAIVMTATLPDAARSELANLIGAKDFSVSADEMDAAGDRPRPRRSWSWRERALTAEAAISAWTEYGRPRHVLVCVNTVARAQRLFRDLRQTLPAEARSVLVHSRFLPHDRDRHETTARAWLGRSTREQPSWVIATQVIEAGLDASADLLLTELAPASSLVQRAGRCARWPRSGGQAVTHGGVLVFRDPELRSVLPYEKGVIEATWAERREINADAGSGFESELVSLAHGASDLEAVRRFRTRLGSRRREVFQALDLGDPSARWQLVRNISSQAVLVRRDASAIDLDRLPETVSVADASLWGILSDPAAVGRTRVPVVPAEGESHSKLGTAWVPPATSTAARVASLLILPPSDAGYDPATGLSLGMAGGETPLHYVDSTASRVRFTYQKDTFEAHIGCCIEAARRFLTCTRASVARLSELLAVSATDIEAGILLAVALHDTGKLSEPWQAWAAAHQKLVHDDTVERCIAHTDYDPTDPRQREVARSVRPGRPHHAVESAVLAKGIVDRWISERSLDDDAANALERAILGSIARHHSTRATKAEPCQTDGRARDCIMRALRCAQHDPSMASELASCVSFLDADLGAHGLLPSTQHEGGALEVMLYAATARIVRLADQHSFDPVPPPEVLA